MQTMINTCVFAFFRYPYIDVCRRVFVDVCLYLNICVYSRVHICAIVHSCVYDRIPMYVCMCNHVVLCMSSCVKECLCTGY